MNTAPADVGEMARSCRTCFMFGEVLRRLGLEVGSANMLDLVRATEYVPIGGNRNDFRLAARALLVHKQSDLALFDEAFQVFWRRPAHGTSMRDLRSMGEERRYRTPRVMPHREDTSDGPPDDQGSEDAENRQPVVDLQRSFSAPRGVAPAGFRRVHARRGIRGACAHGRACLGSGATPHAVASPGATAETIDLRRSMRRSLSHGGEMLELARRQRKTKPRPLVLICDVSGSMETIHPDAAPFRPHRRGKRSALWRLSFSRPGSPASPVISQCAEWIRPLPRLPTPYRTGPAAPASARRSKASTTCGPVGSFGAARWCW